MERLRSDGKVSLSLTDAFASWGIPTAESINMVRHGAPGLPLIASGGIRHGLDIAKAIALGADAVGLASPLLKAANDSSEAVFEDLRELNEGLRLAMFCLGAARFSKLKNSPYLKSRER